MNGLAEHRHTEQTLEQRWAYIQDLCEKAMQAEEGGRRIFTTLDYQRLAKYAGSEPIPYLDVASEDFMEKIIKFKGYFIDEFLRLKSNKEAVVNWTAFDGESLTPGEIAGAVSSAITENRRNIEKGGHLVTLVTTDDILFQFYLAKKLKKMLRQATQ